MQMTDNIEIAMARRSNQSKDGNEQPVAIDGVDGLLHFREISKLFSLSAVTLS